MSDSIRPVSAPAVRAALGRRQLLTGAAAIAGSTAAAQVIGAAPASASGEPLVFFDLSYVHDVDLEDEAARRAAYDELHAAFTLQGIVNRRGPRLWINFITADEFGPTRIDEYWYEHLRADGGLLVGRPVVTVSSLAELVKHFQSEIKGAVVWDGAVPATSNVASTVAGADDLVALRYDDDPGSVFQTITKSRPGIPPRVWLVNKDGSSLFTGRGRIPGTGRQSTGSAKCDAYLWACERYLRTGRSNALELAFYLDSYWIQGWDAQHSGGWRNALQQALLSNHDYLVGQRGFFLDLHVFDDEAPIDDREQPLGADFETLVEILHTAYEQADAQMICVSGFTPWAYKYTLLADTQSKYHPVATEWRLVEVMSAFNGYVEADAAGFDAMANASVFSHQPIDDFYPQPKPPSTAELRRRGLVVDGEVAPKRYLAYYVGDYDSPAWLYHAMPRFWDHPQRGEIALNWAFNPNLAKRFPTGMDRTRRTRTDNDFFIAGDSGAGYIAPGMLEEPRPLSGLPSGMEQWRSHCEQQYRTWDLTITGFILDGLAPGMTDDGFRAYESFSPDGVAGQKIPRLGMMGDLPVLKQADIPRIAPDQAADAYRGNFEGDLSAPPPVPQYYVGRSVLVDPGWHITVRDRLVASAPEAEITLVDAPTLFALIRADLEDRVTAAPLSTDVQAGVAVPIRLELLNARSGAVDVVVRIEAPDGWSAESVAVTVPGESRRSCLLEVTAPAWAAVGEAVGEKARLVVVTDDGRERRRRAFDASVAEATFAGAPRVSVDLGETNQEDGLAQREGGFDGESRPATVGDRSCRRIHVKNNGFTPFSYMYFAASPTFARWPEGSDLVAKVEYFDEAGITFGLEYDGVDGARTQSGVYTLAGVVETSGSDTWRSHTFRTSAARMTARQPGGPDHRAYDFADLRLFSEQPLAVTRVTVERA